MIGETVIDCRPSVLPVPIPLSELSPDTVSEARKCVSYRPSEETGKSIMDMDTNEITISRIVGYDWEEAGYRPRSSPIAVPVIPPAGTADPYGRGNGFNLDLATVMCDISVIPSLITPLEDVEVPLCSMAAEYAAPATPAHETCTGITGVYSPGGVGTHVDTGVCAGVRGCSGRRGVLAVLGGSVYVAGYDAGRDNGCLFGVIRADTTGGASESGRQDDRLGYGKWPSKLNGHRCSLWKRWRGPPHQQCVRMPRTSGRIYQGKDPLMCVMRNMSRGSQPLVIE